VLAIVGFSLIWGWYHVLSAGLVDILATSGIARSVAATAFGVLGGISVLTRVVSGALADRLGLRPTLTGSVALAGLAVFALLRTDTHAEMYIVLVAFGFGLGSVATLYSPILIDAFGRENAVAVVGIFTIAEAPSAFLMPIVVDSLAPATGGYTVPLTLVGAATLAGAAMFHWGTAGATGRP
jgi:MFS family permease